MRLTEAQFAALPNADKSPVPKRLQVSPGPDISEADFQARVIEVATLRGWSYYHTHDSRRSPAGFPDLVLVRERVVFAELKSERGRVTPEQREWLERLTRAGADARVWRPRDWAEILTTLA